MSRPGRRRRALALSAVVVWSLVAGVAALPGTAVAAGDTAPNCTGVTYGGAGTAADPYRIATVDQLQCIEARGLAANYTLTSDVDASGTSDWHGGSGFDPIGGSTTRFTGTFDGDGHTISGLTVDRIGTDSVGAFAAVGPAGNVTGVGLENGTVTGNTYVGGLVGWNEGTVERSYATVAVTGDASDVGGLVGHSSGPVRRTFATGRVEGNANVGGLVGYSVGTVERSYATGDVSGPVGAVGGLVGDNPGRIERAYATGAVSSDGSEGGLVGYERSNPDVADAYWNTDPNGGAATTTGTGLSTAELQGASATSNMALDFAGTWDTVESGDDDATRDWYPTLTGLDRATQLQATDVYSPAVTSIARSGSTERVTNATSVTFAVTVSESVTGLKSDDFALTTTGTATTANGDGDVSVAGDGSRYDVAVDDVSGDGTLRLDLIDDDGVVDGDGDPLGGPGTTGVGNGSYTDGETVTVDNTAPTVRSVSLVDATDGDGVVAAGESVRITATVTDANAVTVTADAAALDAGAITLADDGPNASPGDDRYSATTTVGTGAESGAQSVAVDATDAAGNGGGQAVASGTLFRRGPVGVASAVEADGRIEVVTDGAVDPTGLVVELDGETIYDGATLGDDADDTAVTGAAPDALDDVEVVPSGVAERRDVLLQDRDGDRLDVDPVRDLDVTLVYEVGDGDTGSVTTDVTLTSDVVAEGDGNADPSEGRRVYQGGDVAIRTDGTNDSVAVRNDDTDSVVVGDATGSNSRTLVIDSTALATGTQYEVTFDGRDDDANTEWFALYDLEWSASLDRSSYDVGETVTVGVSARRGSQPLTAVIENGAGDVLARQSQDLGADAGSTLTFDTGSIDGIYREGGPYTVTVTDDSTTASATLALSFLSIPPGAGSVSDPLSATADSYRLDPGERLEVGAEEGVLENDDRTMDPLTATLIRGPTDGTLTLDRNGSFTYVHRGETAGTDSFVYEVRDLTGGTDRATVTLVVDGTGGEAVDGGPTVFEGAAAVREHVDLPTDATPIRAERARIPANRSGRVAVSFTGNATVSSVRFDAGTAPNGTLTVTEFAASDAVPEGVPGRSLLALRIDGSPPVTGASATVRLTVPRADLRAAGTDTTAVRVAHFRDGAWRLLATDVVDRTGDEVTVAAEADGLSPFALTAVDDAGGGETTASGQRTSASARTAATADSAGAAPSSDSPGGIDPVGAGGVAFVVVAAVLGAAVVARRRRG